MAVQTAITLPKSLFRKYWLTPSIIFNLFFSVSATFVFGTEQTGRFKNGDTPSFVEPNEEIKDVVNDHVVVSGLKGKNVSDQDFYKHIYFFDKNGKAVLKKNFYPKSTTYVTGGDIRHSDKYVVIERFYRIGRDGKDVGDAIVFDNLGNVLWEIPGACMGLVFPDDIKDQILIFDTDKGYFQIYSIRGKRIGKKYFSDQNEKSFPNIEEGEDGPDLLYHDSESSDGKYIAISRNPDGDSSDTENFQNEFTLLRSDGKILFQKKDPYFSFMPGYVSSGLNVVLIREETQYYLNDGSEKGELRNPHSEIVAFDFNGKRLWKLDSEKYSLDGSSVDGSTWKVNRLETVANKIKMVDSGMKINLLTGEMK